MKILILILIILTSCQSKVEKIICNNKWDIISIHLKGSERDENIRLIENSFRPGKKLYSVYFYEDKVLISGYKSKKNKGNFKFEIGKNAEYLNIETDNEYFNKKFKYKLINKDTVIEKFKSTVYELNLSSDSIQIRLKRFTPLELTK